MYEISPQLINFFDLDFFPKKLVSKMKCYKGFTICSGQASKLIAKRRIMKNVLTFQRLIGLEITNTYFEKFQASIICHSWLRTGTLYFCFSTYFDTKGPLISKGLFKISFAPKNERQYFCISAPLFQPLNGGEIKKIRHFILLISDYLTLIFWFELFL